ncbi:hypothetical protein PROFUN_16907, partial [Planoprotostelium fungivorum]
VMPRLFKRKGKKSSTPPTKVACTPQSSERSNSKHVKGESPSVPSSPTSELADKEVASPTEGEQPPSWDGQLFNMINGLQAMVDENRALMESNIDRLKTSLVNVTSLITSVLERLPPKPVTVTTTTGAGRQQQVMEPVTPMRARDRQGLDSPMPQDMRQTEKQPDKPPIVVVREVSQAPKEVTTTTEKEIALPASDLLIADQVGLGLPQWLRDMRVNYGDLTGVWKKLQKMGSPILIGNNNINNNTLRTWMHDIDYRWHAFREDNKSLMLLFIRGIESKNHALQNYTMSFTSTLPIKSWDEFLAGVWHLLYDVNAMEKAIQKLNSARQSVGQPVLAWRNELEQKAMEVSPVLATQPILARLFHGGLLDIIKSSSIDHFPVGGFTTVAAAYKWAWEAERRITQFKPLTGSNHTNANPTIAVVERPRTSTNNNRGLVHATGGREPNRNNNGRDGRDGRDHQSSYPRRDDRGQGRIPRCDAAYVQVVDRDFDPTRPRLNTMEVDGVERRSVTLEIWDLSQRQVNASLPVLIDTGADVSYVSPSVARSYAREVMPHPHPYNPIGANGKPFDRVKEMATLCFGFGDHVETFKFDILDLGGMHVVLGKNWLQVHDPDLKASNNFYPIFTEKACEGHQVDNAHAPCSLAVTMVPRACSQ